MNIIITVLLCFGMITINILPIKGNKQLLLGCVVTEEIRNNMMINIKTIEVLSNITLDLLNQELAGVSEFDVKSEVKKNQKVKEEK